MFCLFNLHHFSTPLLFSVRYYRAKFSLNFKKFAGFSFLFYHKFTLVIVLYVLFIVKFIQAAQLTVFSLEPQVKSCIFGPGAGFILQMVAKMPRLPQKAEPGRLFFIVLLYSILFSTHQCSILQNAQEHGGRSLPPPKSCGWPVIRSTAVPQPALKSAW